MVMESYLFICPFLPVVDVDREGRVVALASPSNTSFNSVPCYCHFHQRIMKSDSCCTYSIFIVERHLNGRSRSAIGPIFTLLDKKVNPALESQESKDELACRSGACSMGHVTCAIQRVSVKDNNSMRRQQRDR
jgi:hypothetical protein